MIFLFKGQLRTAECTWKGQNPNRCKALMFEKQGDPDMSCLLTFLAPHHHSIIFKHLFKCMVLFCVVSKGQMTYYYYYFYQYNWILLRNNSMIIFFHAGPFNFEEGNPKGSLPKLHLNPYSWSKVRINSTSFISCVDNLIF